MLSEINQTQKKQTIYEFILMWNLNTLSTYSRSEENSGYQKPGRCGEGQNEERLVEQVKAQQRGITASVVLHSEVKTLNYNVLDIP